MKNKECGLCRVVDRVCEILPNTQKCKEIMARLQRGEISPSEARRLISEDVPESVFQEAVKKALNEIVQPEKSSPYREDYTPQT